MPFPPTPPDEFHVDTFCPFHSFFSSSLLFSEVQSYFLFKPLLLGFSSSAISSFQMHLSVAPSAWLA